MHACTGEVAHRRALGMTGTGRYARPRRRRVGTTAAGTGECRVGGHAAAGAEQLAPTPARKTSPQRVSPDRGGDVGGGVRRLFF